MSIGHCVLTFVLAATMHDPDMTLFFLFVCLFVCFYFLTDLHFFSLLNLEGVSPCATPGAKHHARLSRTYSKTAAQETATQAASASLADAETC